jgi:hypothetical protein
LAMATRFGGEPQTTIENTLKVTLRMLLTSGAGRYDAVEAEVPKPFRASIVTHANAVDGLVPGQLAFADLAPHALRIIAM